MSQLVFTGPMSEVLTWQVMEKYKGEQFNSKAFFNAHGIELWNSKNEYISYQQVIYRVYFSDKLVVDFWKRCRLFTS